MVGTLGRLAAKGCVFGDNLELQGHGHGWSPCKGSWGDGSESQGIDLQHRETGDERRHEAQSRMEGDCSIIHSRVLA